MSQNNFTEKDLDNIVLNFRNTSGSNRERPDDATIRETARRILEAEQADFAIRKEVKSNSHESTRSVQECPLFTLGMVNGSLYFLDDKCSVEDAIRHDLFDMYVLYFGCN